MSDPATATGGALTWRSWPARERPVAAVGTSMAILATAFVATSLGGHVGFGVLAVVVLLGSLNAFFSPATFHLDETSVRVERWPVTQVRDWNEIRGCYVDARGITLSPFVGRAWLEPYRALRLLTQEQNHRAVVDFIIAHLSDEVPVAGLPEATGR